MTSAGITHATTQLVSAAGAEDVVTTQTATLPGRRERGKRDKLERIAAAASTLFAESGYEAVTTQAVADRADVATGTLFRYATSKPELLLMVYNDDLRSAISDGIRIAGGTPVPIEKIMALLEPLVSAAARNANNTSVYQREILFGDPAGRYRSEALELIGVLESAIADVLSHLPGESARPELHAADAAGAVRLRPGVDVRLAARAIFAVLHLALIHAGLQGDDAAQLRAELLSQLDITLRGITVVTPG